MVPKIVVISQSMYFPWVGMLEQIKLANTFVSYDDVQFSKGSFTNRIQIKTGSGIKWLTIPLKNRKLNQRIDEILIDESKNWRIQHYELLKQSYKAAPFFSEMLEVVDRVFSQSYLNLAELSKESMKTLVEYFQLDSDTEFLNSTVLNIGGKGSSRVLEIVKVVGGNIYLTGHGAMNYLDFEKFERSKIEVRFMDYQAVPYAQMHGSFTPYVSGLDLVANCGKDGNKYICSNHLNWRNFLKI